MRKLHAVFALLLVVSSLPTLAATVQVSGTGILFKASNNEKNTIKIEGQILDGLLGDGFLLQDKTGGDILTIQGGGCTAQGNRVSCAITPTFLRFDLGDENDTIEISSTNVPMIVNGGPGNDTINGGGGDDDIDGDTGNDIIRGGRGNDRLRGGTGDDQLFGERDDDTLIGFTGNDLLDGDGQNDILDGGLGADTLIGGGGIDTFDGGAGDDTIDAQDGNNENIQCGGGKDKVTKDPGDRTKRC